MISNATRAFCAILSMVGAAGLVLFANPANGFAIPPSASAPAAVAAAMPIAIVHRG